MANITGTNNGEVILGTDAADEIHGQGGDDSIRGLNGHDLLYGGPGNDVLNDNDGNDTVYGGDGDDSIGGHIATGQGFDVYYGDAGNDTLESGSNNDLVFGGDGIDYIHGGNEDDTVHGGAGDDTVDGGHGIDLIYGEDGDDLVLGSGSGDDSLFGGEGNDTLSAGVGNDSIDGGEGIDLIYGAPGDDTIHGGGSNDVIQAGQNDDLVYGEAGDDSLVSYTGNDTTYGGLGDDYVEGGHGADLSYGEEGDDTIPFGVDDTIYGGDDRDYFGMDDVFGADDIEFANTGDSTIFVDGGAGVSGTDPSNDWDILDITGVEPGDWRFISKDEDESGSFSGQLEIKLNGYTHVIDFKEIEEFRGLCFSRGTEIETDKGIVKVEDLKAGDRVLTKDNGYKAIDWIGSKTLTSGDLETDTKLYPIRIQAGALGENYPAKDLYVSRQHRIFVQSKFAMRICGEDEVLIAAKDLLGVEGVDIIVDFDEVEYFHILFDQHEIVYSNGCQAESLYTGSEALKSVSSEAREELLQLFPELLDAEFTPMPVRFILDGRGTRNLVRRHEKKAIDLHTA